MLTDLDPLLDDVVDYEDDEDDLTSHEEIVVRRHVGHQLHREERGGGLDPAHLQKFKDQSEITIPQFDIEVLWAEKNPVEMLWTFLGGGSGLVVKGGDS